MNLDMTSYQNDRISRQFQLFFEHSINETIWCFNISRQKSQHEHILRSATQKSNPSLLLKFTRKIYQYTYKRTTCASADDSDNDSNDNISVSESVIGKTVVCVVSLITYLFKVRKYFRKHSGYFDKHRK